MMCLQQLCQTSARHVAGHFQQDGAPAHTAAKTQLWRQDKFPDFWAKGVWLGNIQDLPPIEILWAIVQDKVDNMGRPTSEVTLI